VADRPQTNATITTLVVSSSLDFPCIARRVAETSRGARVNFVVLYTIKFAFGERAGAAVGPIVARSASDPASGVPAAAV
jgi:hypothetical protein